jgi:hypothetical protein
MDASRGLLPVPAFGEVDMSKWWLLAIALVGVWGLVRWAKSRQRDKARVTSRQPDEPRVECPACREDMVDTGRREYWPHLWMDLRIMRCLNCGIERPIIEYPVFVSKCPAAEQKTLSPSDVDDAAALAAELHACQQYGDQPYTVHLQAVVDVLRELKYSTPELEVAAWLHDALEDTSLTAEALAARFGHPIAAIVEGLTFRDSGEDHGYPPGVDGERERFHWEEHHHFYRMGTWTFKVKLADRLANVRAIGRTALPLESQRQLLSKYARQMCCVAAYASMPEDVPPLQVLRNELNAAEQRLRARAGLPVEPTRPEAARYYLVDERPVRLVATPDGQVVTEAYDSRTGDFILDRSYLSRVMWRSPDDNDNFSVSREEFDRRTQELRAKRS